VRRALVVIGLFVGALLASWFAFLAAGLPPLDSLFEVVSALGTVGLSAGLARPELPAALKGVLCLDMLLGRLEILAVLVALSPRTWLGRRAV
jgi:trk system potassium uptake protein TrkH